MKTLLRAPLLRPEEWAKAATSANEWAKAHRIATFCSKEFLGKDTNIKNTHAGYWKRVIAWIEGNAPAGALTEVENEPAKFT